MQEGGPYHPAGAVYGPSGTPRVRSHVSPAARGGDPDLYRQPGHNARHQYYGVAVEHTDGRTPASPQPAARAQRHSGDAVPPLSAEPLCGPIVPATPRIRLPTQFTGLWEHSVGRGVGTRHEDDMRERRVAAPLAGVDVPGTGEGEVRRLHGADANPTVAPPKLVPRAFGARGGPPKDSSIVLRGLRSPPTGPEPAVHGAKSSVAVERGSNSVLSRSMSASRRVGRVAEFTVSRLTGSAPDGASGSGYLEKSAELTSKGIRSPC
jgi:hypothetical protein